MLRLVIFDEGFDNSKEEFVRLDEVVLELEHSLVSLSKWESHWELPFLSTVHKTQEQMLWYIEAMTLTPEIPPGVFDRLSHENLTQINEYLGAKHSATWFNDPQDARPSREIITSEIIYHWMVTLNIPFTCETWHLNRLLAFIRVCNLKNGTQKKMSKAEIAHQNRTLNEQRKAQMGTTG